MRKVALLAVLLLALAAGSFVRAAFPGSNGKIVFVRQGPGPGVRLHLINADGTGISELKRLESGTFERSPYCCDWYVSPAWSPDGRSIAFNAGGATGNYWVYYGAADGTRFRPLPAPSGLGPTDSPAWSPDGKQIAAVAFDPNENGGGSRVYITRLEAGRVSRTFRPARGRASSLDDNDPAWSPDGRWICFDRRASETLRHGAGKPHLVLVRPDGTGEKQLSSHAGENPAWAPDANRIAFDDGHNVYTIKPDGTGLTRLTRAAGQTDSYDPVWSPNGSSIVFVRGRRTGRRDLWLMNANGSRQRLLVRNGYDPDWQPITR